MIVESFCSPAIIRIIIVEIIPIIIPITVENKNEWMAKDVLKVVLINMFC